MDDNNYLVCTGHDSTDHESTPVLSVTDHVGMVGMVGMVSVVQHHINQATSLWPAHVTALNDFNQPD